MKLLNKIIEYVLAFLVVVMVAGCFWQIFTRFILNDPSKWTEELRSEEHTSELQSPS